MSVFKCKMCGGTIEFEQGASIGICDSCGTKQTLPKLDDDRRANLYDRANHFRRNNEFDKAMGIYETILNEDPSDAEAYWSLVLCRYGIEYVEDPATHRRVPTVNRAQYTSVLADEDYRSAIANADALQKTIYEEEARAIDEIQKGILEISQKEEPFDVFICYKETDENGNRTKDSVLAQEVYDALTKENLKVFFSRITLEDKLGQQYEPFIFSALNSAKAMIIVGTSAGNINSPWVKNEWSRFLNIVKNDHSKVLIPCYKDMNPYDMPDELSLLQSQDMSKLGFIQDLIRGVKKYTDKSSDAPVTVVQTVIQQVQTPATVDIKFIDFIKRHKKLLMTVIPIVLVAAIVIASVTISAKNRKNSYSTNSVTATSTIKPEKVVNSDKNAALNNYFSFDYEKYEFATEKVYAHNADYNYDYLSHNISSQNIVIRGTIINLTNVSIPLSGRRFQTKLKLDNSMYEGEMLVEEGNGESFDSFGNLNPDTKRPVTFCFEMTKESFEKAKSVVLYIYLNPEVNAGYVKDYWDSKDTKCLGIKIK